MTTALTVRTDTSTALTVNHVRAKPAPSFAYLVDRITARIATSAEVLYFKKRYGHLLVKPEQVKVVEYALARALYREDQDLTLDQTALLAGMTVTKALAYFHRLRIKVTDIVKNNEASALMTAVADYDA